jgi:uncharacterized protein
MPNPFYYDRPLPPEEAIDRPAERRRLAELAEGGQSSRLTAPRRYGKTTLIGALAEELRARRWVVCVADFSRSRRLEDAAERLQEAWRRGLDRRGTRRIWRSMSRELEATLEAGVPGVVRARVRGRASGQSGRPLARLHALLALPESLAATSGRRILVVFDEFQDLLTAGEDLDGIVRSHVQHQSGVASYCFAGSQASVLAALFEDRRRPLFAQARAVGLSPIADEEIASWVSEQFERAGRPLPAGTAEALAAGTNGHPQRAAMVAHYLWEQPRVDEAAVLAAESEALSAASGELDQMWAGLTRAQRQVLGAVAEGRAPLLSRSSLDEMGLGKSTAQQARDKLEADGHVRREGRDLVATDPFVARWLG